MTIHRILYCKPPCNILKHVKCTQSAKLLTRSAERVDCAFTIDKIEKSSCCCFCFCFICDTLGSCSKSKQRKQQSKHGNEEIVEPEQVGIFVQEPTTPPELKGVHPLTHGAFDSKEGEQTQFDACVSRIEPGNSLTC